ncbi:TrmH family RNA methyltransferase [Sandaracinus amylolyticus]|uniref:tRNA/rRNA methyltransferase n=1 Tax=Sandaracinus amylolyticus TaxID=927083 RepID=A0A0F6W5X1_9BACT|nr:TrmH family RNA methyltransferase [Sandaracinus amylolyticus]AKF08090.1 tRNA/rRNA methyltransferase [Sandaracinus amylolyticus]
MAYVPPLGMPIDEVRRELDRIRHPVRIAIRRSKNPFNVGAIIRTAHSFLVREIVLIGIEPWYERAAMGMQRYENVVEVESEAAFVAMAKERGWFLCSLEKDDASVGLWDAKMPEHCVIVVGNEEEGVGAEILAASDEVIGIPMFGINHSYPMTVAAGIAMAEWARRRYAGAGRVIVTPKE